MGFIGGRATAIFISRTAPDGRGAACARLLAEPAFELSTPHPSGPEWPPSSRARCCQRGLTCMPPACCLLLLLLLLLDLRSSLPRLRLDPAAREAGNSRHRTAQQTARSPTAMTARV